MGQKKCWIGAAIGAATSIAGGLFSANSNKKRQRRMNMYNNRANLFQEANNLTVARVEDADGDELVQLSAKYGTKAKLKPKYYNRSDLLRCGGKRSRK